MGWSSAYIPCTVIKLNQSEKRWLKVAYYSFFPNNNVRDAHNKQATQDLSSKQNSCQQDKENLTIKKYENLLKKIPCYAGVSKK